MTLRENLDCYAQVEQRKILIKLSESGDVSKHFFLTGGTALSVFYLHHRISEDIDLFTIDIINFSEILLWIRSVWPDSHVLIRSSQYFLSLSIKDVRVDFVHDPLSMKIDRHIFTWRNGMSLAIDNIKNIASNKLCTLVSRTEPKDFVDFYFLFKKCSTIELKDVLLNAKRKEAIFDDPPTAAYQIEENIRFVREHEELFPPLKIKLELDDFYKFFRDIVRYLYDMVSP